MDSCAAQNMPAIRIAQFNVLVNSYGLIVWDSLKKWQHFCDIGSCVKRLGFVAAFPLTPLAYKCRISFLNVRRVGSQNFQ